jgi:hypothetical protein
LWYLHPGDAARRHLAGQLRDQQLHTVFTCSIHTLANSKSTTVYLLYLYKTLNSLGIISHKVNIHTFVSHTFYNVNLPIARSGAGINIKTFLVLIDEKTHGPNN